MRRGGGDLIAIASLLTLGILGPTATAEAQISGQMGEADRPRPEDWHPPPSGPDPSPRERIDLIGALWYCRHLVVNAIQAYWIVEKNREACERAKAAVSPRTSSAQQRAAQDCWPSLDAAFREVETAKQFFEQAKKTGAPAQTQLVHEGNRHLALAKAEVDKAGRCLERARGTPSRRN